MQVFDISMRFLFELLKEFRTFWGHKKVIWFPEIGRVKIFYQSPTGIIKCVSEYTFLIKKTTTTKKKQKKKTRRQKVKETKEEKSMSVENLSGFDESVCEFGQCNSVF